MGSSMAQHNTAGTLLPRDPHQQLVRSMDTGKHLLEHTGATWEAQCPSLRQDRKIRRILKTWEGKRSPSLQSLVEVSCQLRSRLLIQLTFAVKVASRENIPYLFVSNISLIKHSIHIP